MPSMTMRLSGLSIESQMASTAPIARRPVTSSTSSCRWLQRVTRQGARIPDGVSCRSPDHRRGALRPGRCPRLDTRGDVPRSSSMRRDASALLDALGDVAPAVVGERREVRHLRGRRRLVAGGPVVGVLGRAGLVGAHGLPVPRVPGYYTGAARGDHGCRTWPPQSGVAEIPATEAALLADPSQHGPRFARGADRCDGSCAAYRAGSPCAAGEVNEPSWLRSVTNSRHGGRGGHGRPITRLSVLAASGISRCAGGRVGQLTPGRDVRGLGSLSREWVR